MWACFGICLPFSEEWCCLLAALPWKESKKWVSQMLLLHIFAPLHDPQQLPQPLTSRVLVGKGRGEER